MTGKVRQILFGCTLGLFLIISSSLYADAPPPPGGNPVTGRAGANATPIGGGASIGGGLLILAVLGVGYAAKKWYDTRLDTAKSTDNE